MTVPSGTRTLVLNDDYVPLNRVHWKRGIKRLFDRPCKNCYGKGFIRHGMPCPYCVKGIVPAARAVEYYDITIRDSKQREYYVPAVIANTHHVKRAHKKVPYSRPNIFKRDNYTCQYCAKKFGPQDLTLDHVVPRSIWNGNGTPTCWTNIVAACQKCNAKKDNRTPEQAGMPLQKHLRNGVIVEYKRPKTPTQQEIRLGLTQHTIPDEWVQYVEPFIKSWQVT